VRSGRVVSQIESFQVKLPFIQNPSPGSIFVKEDRKAIEQFVSEPTTAIKDMERQFIDLKLLLTKQNPRI
jgi:hypothetical protein